MSHTSRSFFAQHRILVSLAAACLLVALIALAAISRGGGGTAEANDIDPETRATFAVFERPRTARDDIPETADTAASYVSDRQPGENRSQSRRVDLQGGAAYIWPMQGGVCATWGNCVRTSVVRQLGVALSSDAVVPPAGEPTSIELAGIARNGISSVRFVIPGTDDVIAEVHDNLLSATLTGQPTRMYWRDSSGQEHPGPALPQLVPSHTKLQLPR